MPATDLLDHVPKQLTTRTSDNPYAGTSALTGPVQDVPELTFVDVLSRREGIVLGLLILGQILTGLTFLGWLLWPTHLPTSAGQGWLPFVASVVAVVLMVSIEVIRMAQGAALWLFATRAKDPVPMRPRAGLRVALLTTIVPNKEPLELVLRTLDAMRRVRHDGPVDVWLLDEGGDPIIAAECAAIGVNHFSRNGIAAYNTDAGEFRARTKAGNHNAWRAEHEHAYDVVAQMDPDHVPEPDFLERTLGYFTDTDVAFVVAPQVYGNLRESWIAKGAAIQAYVFHGVIQRGGNGMAAPLLIGTNHLYRPSAFKVIGGYQDSIIEDHLTSMALFATENPETGNRFRGVYTPDILAVGEGPTSFTDYFNQQKRWAYGIWQIAGNHSPRLFRQMRPAQRLSFSLLQLFYPSVAISFVLGNVLTALFVLGGASTRLPVLEWLLVWGASMSTTLGTFFWLRRFNLVEHERSEYGMAGLGLMLTCLPVYAEAAWAFLTRRPLAYAVTAKGQLTSGDGLGTFRVHLGWLAAAVVLLAASTVSGFGQDYPSVRFWLLVTMASCGAPAAIHAVRRLAAFGLWGDPRGRRSAAGARLVPARPASP